MTHSRVCSQVTCDHHMFTQFWSIMLLVARYIILGTGKQFL